VDTDFDGKRTIVGEPGWAHFPVSTFDACASLYRTSFIGVHPWFN